MCAFYLAMPTDMSPEATILVPDLADKARWAGLLSEAAV